MAAKTPDTAKAPAQTGSPFSFEDAPVPATSRTVEPNPFTEVVNSLAESMTDGKSAGAKRITVSKSKDKTLKQVLGKVERNLQDAAQAANVTVRKIVDENGGDSAVVTFWTVTRIEKPRKAKADAAAK